MMKKLQNQHPLLPAIAIFAILLTGCVKQADTATAPPVKGNEIFDYATTVNIPLSVDYSMDGNKALFEVYVRNPLAEIDGVAGKKKRSRPFSKPTPTTKAGSTE